MMRRPGRPTGGAEGRRKKPWDPARLRARDKEALMYVAANSDLERYRIAEFLDISLSRLSVLTCSAVGQQYMAERERAWNRVMVVTSRRSAAVRPGFSLLELLLVLTVNLLLTAMMLPVLAGLRESAHRVVCSSNLRHGTCPPHTSV